VPLAQPRFYSRDGGQTWEPDRPADFLTARFMRVWIGDMPPGHPAGQHPNLSPLSDHCAVPQ
jgi:hypothetical protein